MAAPVRNVRCVTCGEWDDDEEWDTYAEMRDELRACGWSVAGDHSVCPDCAEVISVWQNGGRPPPNVLAAREYRATR